MASLLFGVVVTSQGVAAPVGELTYQGPITAATASSLDGATGAAVSPDGANVYVASDGGADEAGDAVTRLDRNAQTGALVYGQCFTQEASCSGGTNSTGNQAGLEVPSSIAVSPGGDSVYVASAGGANVSGSAIVHFSRNPTTGALTRQSCFADQVTASCTVSLLARLGEATSVEVSSDGDSVYVVAATTNSIAHFSRASDGTLTPVSCFSAVSECTAAGSGFINYTSLEGANDVAVSPDGLSVYVTATAAPPATTNAVTRFNRNPATGALTYDGCFTASASTCGANAVTSRPGLGDPSGVAVSPDNKSVYVTAFAGDSIVHFSRDLNSGALTHQGCLTQQGAGCAGNFMIGLNAASSVDVSSDGRNVYVAAADPDDPNAISTLTRLGRNPDGSLTYGSCMTSSNFGGCGLGNGSKAGLTGASHVTLSPDGRHVYVSADIDSAVTRFDRVLDTPPTACTPPATVSTPRDTPVQVALGCSDPNGDPVVADFPQSPAHGALTPGGLFTPQAGYVGADSFTVRAVDGFGVAGPAVQVGVNVTAPAGGTTGGGTTGGGTGGGVTSTGTAGSKATLSGLTLTRSFKPLRAGASLAAKGPATLTFTLNVAGRVTFRVEKLVAGRRVGKRCVAKATKGSACTAVQTIAGRFGHLGKAGGNKVFFTGRVGGRSLLKGRYRLVALTENGNQATATFTIR